MYGFGFRKAEHMFASLEVWVYGGYLVVRALWGFRWGWGRGAVGRVFGWVQYKIPYSDPKPFDATTFKIPPPTPSHLNPKPKPP